MTDAKNKFRQMTTAAPVRLVIRHSFPTILSAFLPSIASMVDAFFMARLGTAACGAVGIAFPIVAAIQTIGFVFGTGAGSLLSRSLGAREHQKASAIASAAFFSSLIFSLVFSGVCLIFRNSLLRLLGAGDGVLFALAKTYTVCLLFAAPLMCAAFVLSNLLRAEGRTVWAMCGLGLGNVSCVLSIPLLMFRGNLGVLGAGLSFTIGYGLAVLILLFPYLFRKSTVFLLAKFEIQNILEILRNGLPSLFRQGLTAVAVVLLNRAAGPYGDAAIAALALTSRLFLFLYAFLLGIGQGSAPIAGYNYGNGDRSRTLVIYKVSLTIACVLGLLLAIPTAIFAPLAIGWFRSDEMTVRYGTLFLRALCAVLPLHGIIAVTNIFLQALGKPISASLVAAARQGFLFLPFVFLLPRRFGFAGLFLTQPIADALTFLFTIPFAIFLFRELKKAYPKGSA